MTEILVGIDKGKFSISYAHILFDEKFSKCYRIHGHTGIVEVYVLGKENDDGVVIDFNELKRIVRSVIKELDHKVLIPMNNKDIELTVDENIVKIQHNKKLWVFPKEDVYFLHSNQATAENIAKELYFNIKIHLKNFKIRVRFYEGLNSFAEVGD